MPIAYDPSRLALYSPELRETLFERGKSYTDIQIAIEASRLAYLRADRSMPDAQQLAEALARVGFEFTGLFRESTTNTQAFGAYRESDQTALIAFRGTQADDVNDLITDIQLALVEWPESGGFVHEGFAAAFRSVRSQIDEWMKRGDKSKARIILTGHSLGGALATLAASAMKPALLVTLGSPRVGDEEFAESVKAQKITRLVDCSDIVTDVPFEETGYRHVGDTTYINRNGQVIENPTEASISDDRAIAEVEYLTTHATNPLQNVLLRRLADHAPINYARAFFD